MMLNPFVPFDRRLFHRLLENGHTHFVRQTYPRGLDGLSEDIKETFLVSYYNNAGQAQIHLQALAQDRHRFLYEMAVADHKERLEKATGGLLGYRLFAPILPGPWKPGELFGEKIRQYIARHLQWKPGRGDTVKTDLFVQFGELFLTLRYRTHEVKIPLEDIERL